MSKGRHINRRRKVPRFCPQCGEPNVRASKVTMWCDRCKWTEAR